MFVALLTFEQKHLKMHERLQKEEEVFQQDGSFTCEICGKQFQRRLSLGRHLGKHKTYEENTPEEYNQKKAQRVVVAKDKKRVALREYKKRRRLRDLKQKQLEQLKTLETTD
jgi:hypothetical protein